MAKALCPGSFDPVTNGHVDVIERAARYFEGVVVAVIRNPSKNPLFTLEERTAMLSDALSGVDNIEISSFDGLLVDHAHALGISLVIKGLRAVSDFEYELQMALMNRHLNESAETVFMMPAEQYTYTSSRLIKEVFSLGGQVRGLVPEIVESRLSEKQRGNVHVS